MLGDGMSEAAILEEFEALDADDIRAAVRFAAESLNHPILNAI